MKNLKMLIAGVLIGSTVTMSVSVMADLPSVRAYLTSYSIKVDGNNITIPDDMDVLNYKDRAYVPTKLIVEAMGGSTAFDAQTGTITIAKPKPVVKEVIREVPVEVEVIKEVPVEVIREVEKKVYVEPDVNYSYTPITVNSGSLSVYLQSIHQGSESTTLYLEVSNIGQDYALFDFNSFYINAGGTTVRPRDNYSWGNSFEAYTYNRSMILTFNKVPDDVRNISVVLPYRMGNGYEGRQVVLNVRVR